MRSNTAVFDDISNFLPETIWLANPTVILTELKERAVLGTIFLQADWQAAVV